MSNENNDEMVLSSGMDVPGYQLLADVLKRAYDQASTGKGKERHANDLPFHEQPMQQIADLQGSTHGMSFQAIKKIKEADGLPALNAQVSELLGAINYIAGMVIWLEKQPVKQDVRIVNSVDPLGLMPLTEEARQKIVESLQNNIHRPIGIKPGLRVDPNKIIGADNGVVDHE